MLLLLLVLPLVASHPCATTAILSALELQPCPLLSPQQATATVQKVTHCLLIHHGLSAPSCLLASDPKCLSTLPAHAHATYERLNARWEVLCAAATAVRTADELQAAVQTPTAKARQKDVLKKAQREAELAVERAVLALEAVADVQSIIQEVLHGGRSVAANVKEVVETEGRNVKQVREGVKKLRKIVQDIRALNKEDKKKVKENEVWFADWMVFSCGVASGRVWVGLLVAALITGVKIGDFVMPLLAEVQRERLVLIGYVGRALAVVSCVGALMWPPNIGSVTAESRCMGDSNETETREVEDSSPVFEGE